MYFTRTSPMMRERNVDTMSTTVAEKMLCAWVGWRAPRKRVQRERARGNDGVGGWDGGELATADDAIRPAAGRGNQSSATRILLA
jgi:hypothetical protein